MFDSIAKAWKEVAADDSLNETSVNFSPATRTQASRAGKRRHGSHHGSDSGSKYDYGSSHAVDRARSSSHTRHAYSSKVLKPSTDNKKNQKSGTSLWNALGKIGQTIIGDGSGENKELKSMKSYMNGMIGSGDNPGRVNDIRSRVESISERAQRFTRENRSPGKNVKGYSSGGTMRRIHLKDLAEADSSADSLSRRVKRAHVDFSRDRATATPKVTTTAASRPPPIDIPSSPYINGETHTDIHTSNVADRSEVEELSRKVEALENTVNSLVEELRKSNDIKRDILNSDDMRVIPAPVSEVEHRSMDSTAQEVRDKPDRAPDHRESEDEFEEVNRSLSPVKLDFDKFKFVR